MAIASVSCYSLSVRILSLFRLPWLTLIIELASTGRAGCTDSVCKKNAEKIPKGELRLGTWVTIKDHASWKWRHW